MRANKADERVNRYRETIYPYYFLFRPVTLQHSTARYFTGRRIYSRPSDPSFLITTLHPDVVSESEHLRHPAGQIAFRHRGVDLDGGEFQVRRLLAEDVREHLVAFEQVAQGSGSGDAAAHPCARGSNAAEVPRPRFQWSPSRGPRVRQHQGWSPRRRREGGLRVVVAADSSARSLGRGRGGRCEPCGPAASPAAAPRPRAPPRRRPPRRSRPGSRRACPTPSASPASC